LPELLVLVRFEDGHGCSDGVKMSNLCLWMTVSACSAVLAAKTCAVKIPLTQGVLFLVPFERVRQDLTHRLELLVVTRTDEESGAFVLVILPILLLVWALGADFSFHFGGLTMFVLAFWKTSLYRIEFARLDLESTIGQILADSFWVDEDSAEHKKSYNK
jgi:hypothetical protein